MKRELFKDFAVSVFCFVLFSGYAQAFVPDKGQPGTAQEQALDGVKDGTGTLPEAIKAGEEKKYKEAGFLPKFKVRSGDDLGLIDSEAAGNGNIQAAKQKKYKDGELLVKFKKGVGDQKKKDKHKKHHAKRHKKYKHLDIERLQLDPGITVEGAVAAYKADADVEFAEPNYIVQALGMPNDPLLGNLWGLNNTGQTGGTSGADINAPEAWDIATGNGGGSVVVAVIDTGIDYNHEDLAGNLWVNTAEIPGNGIDDDNNGYVDDVYGINAITGTGDPFDDHGHGTHCAGTIGAVGNNGIGVAGVNWNVKVMACKFLGSDGSGAISDAAECLDYVKMMKDRGVNIAVTSNSWGGGGYSQAFYDSLMVHMQSDILFVAAAGNSNSDNDTYANYPSNYDLPNVVAVAATDHNDAKASFSSYGPHTVHVGAPGVDIVSLRSGSTDMYGDGAHFIPNGDPTAKYYRASGTSMATPHVAGLAALIKSADNTRDWKSVKNLILSGGDTVSSMSGKTITGKRINAYVSLTCADSPVFAVLKFPAALEFVPTTLAVLNINCGSPAGPVAATVTTGETLELKDDGLAPDMAAGDGIYSVTWTPTGSDPTVGITFSNGISTVEEHVSVTPIKITTFLLRHDAVNSNYSQTLAATGAVPPYTWNIAEGALPDGLTLNSATGVISGIPTRPGRYEFTVMAADSFPVQSTGTRELSITIYNGDVMRPQWNRTDSAGTAWGNAVTYDDQGNVYAAGSTESGFTVMKYDSSGNLLWRNNSGMGGSPYLISVDGAGNLYATGCYVVNYDCQYLTKKYDGSGALLWEKVYAGSMLGVGLAVDRLGYAYVAGRDVLLKYSPDGETVWTTNSVIHAPTDLLVDDDNNLYLVHVEGMVAKYNSAGQLLETINLNGLVGYATNMALDKSRNIYVTVVVPSGWDYLNGYMVEKHSPQGEFLWKKEYAGGSYDYGYDIAVDGNGNSFVTGESYQPESYWGATPGIFTIMYDTAGNELGAREYRTYINQGGSVAVDPHGNVYLVGTSLRHIETLKYTYFDISPVLLENGAAGINYQQPLSPIGGASPYTWAVTSGNLPSGLTLNGTTGEITGLPDTPGTYSFTTEVTDANSLKASRAYTIAIDNSIIAPSSLPSAFRGMQYSQPLSVIGLASTWTWQVSAGSLPAGLILDAATGGISGVPGSYGVYSFSVTATGTDLRTITREYSLGVKEPLTIYPASGALPLGIVSNAYSTSLEATGGKNPYAWTIAQGALPDGLSLDSASGRISGTPSVAGTFTFVVQVADADSWAVSKQFSVSIYNAPVITPPSGWAVRPQNKSASWTHTATGGLTPYTWSIASGSLGPGLSLNSATGVISGTPTVLGWYNYTLQVTDSLGLTDTENFEFYVYEVLDIKTTSLLYVMTGSAYSAALAAAGGTPPYTWSIISGVLPPDLSLDSATGDITGTAITAGVFSFTAQVRDAHYATDTQLLTITIYDPLAISTTALVPGTPGESYSQVLAATGGLPPHTWSITSGSLPPGLFLDSTAGEISGTPYQNGIYSFTAAVTDGNGTSATAPLSITIDGVGIATTQLVPGTLGTPYGQPMMTIGGLAPYTWAVASGSVPTGLTLNSATGEISGVPTAVGMYQVTFQVTDANQNTKTKTLLMSINDIVLQWARTYDSGQYDYASRKIAVDASGNSYVAGYSNNGTNNDYVTMKYSPSGDLLWMQRYDTGFDEYPQFMALDAAGNAYVTGYSYNGTILVALTVKYDSEGNILWSQTHSNGNYEIATGIAADSAGNAYVTGYSHNGTNGDFVTTKYDSAGNVAWSQTYDSGYDDYAQIIAVDGSGNPYVAGYSSNGTDYDIVTIKYATAGEAVWIQRSDGGVYEYATDIELDAAGNAYITGSSYNGTNNDILTIKYNSDGALAWSRKTDSGLEKYAADIALDGAGNTYVAGFSYNGTNWGVETIKYDSAGNAAWTRRYDLASDESANIALDGTGNAYVSTFSHNGTNWDILILKYAPDGNMVWIQIYDSGSDDYLSSMTLDAQGNVYLNGISWNGVNQDILAIKYYKAGQGIVIMPTALPNAGYNNEYHETLGALGGMAPYSWNIASGTLPDGLSLNAQTGEISGTATVLNASHTFTVGATDTNGATAQQAYSITVLNMPTITNSSLSSGVLGAYYSQRLVAKGGSTPYDWSINSGRLPSGLTLDSATGLISGAPGETGSFRFRVQVVDAVGISGSKDFTINVDYMAITTTQLTSGVIGSSYYQALMLSGGTYPYSWSISTGSLPPGINLDSATGELSGTPSQAGVYPFTVTVTDAVNASASASLSITIDEIGIATTQLAPGTVGTSYSQALTATGGTAPFTWTVTSGSLPAGLTLNSATGEISGVPATVGMNEVTFQVTDANQHAKTKTLVMSINDILLQWARTYDGGDNDYIARKTTVDASGNTYVTGYSYNGSTYDSVTVKYSPSGDVLWMQRADNGYDEYPQSIALDPAGNVYVTGYYYNGAIQAALTIKYDSEGNMLWRRTYSNGSYDIAESIAVDAGGNAYISGQSYNGVTYDIVAIKYDASGNQVWSRTYNNEFGAYAELIAVDSSGNPYVTGYASNGTGEDIVTIKYTTSGEVVWTQTHDSGIYDYPYDIKLDAAGSAYITGRSYNGTDYDVLTLKYASDGGLLWSRTYDNGYRDYPEGIALDGAGNSYVAAFTYNGTAWEALTIKYDSAGNTAWFRRYELTRRDRIRVAVDGSGNPHVVTGSNNGTDDDILILKYDAAGNLIWTQLYDSGSDDRFQSMALDGQGNVYLNGRSWNEANQDYLTIKYYKVGQGILIAPAALPDAGYNIAYQQSLTALGGMAPYAWSISSGTLPDGLTLNAQTGEISGTATTLHAVHTFTAMATDALGATAGQAYSITVVDMPVITNAGLPSGVMYTAYNQLLNVSGGSAPYIWSISSGILPAGMTLNGATGRISGWPNEAGTFTVTVQVTDANGLTAVKDFTITIANMAIGTTQLASGIVGTPYYQTLSLLGNPYYPCTWSISSGSLPPGITLNGATGELSGTPSQAGVYAFTVTVIDSNGTSASASLSITIDETAIATTRLLPGTVGSAYSQTLTATGGTAPYAWAVTSGSLPTGLTLNSTTGEISGVPTAVGMHQVAFQVTDANQNATTKTLVISINDIMLQWAEKYDGGQDEYTSGKIAVDTLGNSYVTGYSYNGTNGDYLTIKYSPSGDVLWTQRADTGFDEYPQSIALDPAGNVYVTGYSWNGTTNDVLTIKYASEGNMLWSRTNSNGAYEQVGTGVAVDSAGNSYITGYSYNGTNYDILAVKYDPAGNMIWSRTHGKEIEQYPSDIAADSAGNAYITGNAYSGTNWDIVTIKYTPTGEMAWTRRHDTGFDESPNRMAVDAARNVYVSGYSYNGMDGDIVTIKYDAAGELAWSRTRDSGFDEGPVGMVVDDTGAAYVTANSHNGTNWDTWTAKYDSAGNMVWQHQYDGGHEENASGIVIDSSGNAYVTVSFYNGTNQDVQIMKYGSGGSMLWTQLYDSGSDDYLDGMAIDSQGNLFLKGSAWNGTNDYLTVKYYKVGQGIAIMPATLSNPGFNINYRVVLRALGGVEPYAWSIINGTLSDGLSLNAVTGEISGTATANHATHTFTAKATDSTGATAEQVYTLTVADAPVILTEALPDAVIWIEYRTTLAATGGSGAYEWSITAGRLPGGLILNRTTGEISGTAWELGTYPVTITLTDINSNIVISRDFSLYVNVIGIANNTLAEGMVRVQYSETLTGIGGTPPYTWAVISGALPDGLVLGSSAGEISGIPATSGVFTFAVQVTDSAGAVSTKTFTITINPPLPDLIMTLVSGPETAQPGQSVTVSNTVINQGVENSAPFTVCIYLSSDSTISRSDILLATRHLCNGLDAGTESTAETANFVIPASMANGPYYIGAIADCTGEVPEIEETNNSITGNQITISQ